jgi:hypothetical protein
MIKGFPSLFPIQLVKDTVKPIKTEKKDKDKDEPKKTDKGCSVSPAQKTKKC